MINISPGNVLDIVLFKTIKLEQEKLNSIEDRGIDYHESCWKYVYVINERIFLL